MLYKPKRNKYFESTCNERSKKTSYQQFRATVERSVFVLSLRQIPCCVRKSEVGMADDNDLSNSPYLKLVVLSKMRWRFA